MQKIIISSGNKVFKGEPIARVSEKGKNKLYFELRKNGKIINKELYDLSERLDTVDNVSSKGSVIEEELTKQIPNTK